MLDVVVNGAGRRLPAGTTVQALVGDLLPASPGLDMLPAPAAGRGIDPLTKPAAGRGAAVAVNGRVVPRSAWPSATLACGDRVEVLVAAQGG